MRRIIKFIACGLLMSMLLIGCGNSSYDKFMEEGKLALASNDYETALNMFKLANQEKESDESDALIKQTDAYIRLEASKVDEPVDVLVEICNEILSYKSKSTYITDNVQALKDEYEQVLEEVINVRTSYNDRMDYIEETYFNEANYKDALSDLEELRSEIKPYIDVAVNKNYRNELDRCNELISKCKSIISGNNENERNNKLLAEMEADGFTKEKAVQYAIQAYEGKEEHYPIIGVKVIEGKACYEIQVKAETSDGHLSTAFVAYVFEDGTVKNQFEVQ